MMDIPNKVVTQKLKDIEQAYHSVTSALNTNLTQSTSTMKNYLSLFKLFDKNYLIPNRLQGVFDNSGGLEYKYSNAMLERQTTKANEEAMTAYQGYLTAEQNRTYAYANGTEEQRQIAEKAFKEAAYLFEEKLMASSVAQIENLVQAIKNVDDYFKDINSYTDTLITGLSNAKEYYELLYENDSEKAFAKKVEYNLQIIEQTQNKYDVLKRDIADLEFYLKRAVQSGEITEGDNTWRRLKQIIESNKNELTQLDIELLKLQRDMINMPNEELQDQIDEINKRYGVLNSMISNNIASSESMIQVMNRLNEVTMKTLGNIGQLFLHYGPIKDQNEMLNSQLGQQIEILNANYQEFAKIRTYYNRMKFMPKEMYSDEYREQIKEQYESMRDAFMEE